MIVYIQIDTLNKGGGEGGQIGKKGQKEKKEQKDSNVDNKKYIINYIKRLYLSHGFTYSISRNSKISFSSTNTLSSNIPSLSST